MTLSAAATEIDLDALLVALTLAPTTFSRNRFFGLYTDPAARRVHRRAALLRGVMKQLVAPEGPRGVTLAPEEGGGGLLAYEMPALGLRRTVTLEPLELSVLRFAIARGRDLVPDVLAALRPDPSDAPQVEAALSRLMPEACYDGAADPRA